jgi:hypothetical protein
MAPLQDLLTKVRDTVDIGFVSMHVRSSRVDGTLIKSLKLFLDFSSVLTKGQIEEMASADEFEVVKEVQVKSG